MTNADDLTGSHRVMLLDIGNTNLKWAWLQGVRPGKVTRVSHQGYAIEQLAAREWADITVPSQTYISCVADQNLEQGLSAWISKCWGHEARFVQSTAQACGVTNAYMEPERLGVDRWLTMIALHAKLPGPVCVVDCGTAVTIDVLGHAGRHLGGLILPGFGLMQQALLEHTAIPFNGDVEQDCLLAIDTESAIAAGGVNAVAALVERIVQKMGARTEESLSLVLTGSDAERLHRTLALPSVIEKDLVMQGLITLINTEAHRAAS